MKIYTKEVMSVEGISDEDFARIFSEATRQRVLSKLDELVGRCLQLAPGSDERDEADAALESLNNSIEVYERGYRFYHDELAKRETIRKTEARLEKVHYAAERAEREVYYTRPYGKVARLFSRWLGPLPTPALRVDATHEALKSVPSYQFLAFSLVVGILGFVIVVVRYIPWLSISPASFVGGLIGSLFAASGAGVSSSGSPLSSVTLLAILLPISGLVVYLYARKLRKFSSFINKAACQKEQWFRMGAENWSYRQRLMSCLSFGAWHITSLAYPLSVLLGLSLVSAVFMAIYLHEYRRSGDVRRATLASTQLHAAFNQYAIGWTAACLVLLVASFFI